MCYLNQPSNHPTNHMPVQQIVSRHNQKLSLYTDTLLGGVNKGINLDINSQAPVHAICEHECVDA